MRSEWAAGRGVVHNWQHIVRWAASALHLIEGQASGSGALQLGVQAAAAVAHGSAVSVNACLMRAVCTASACAPPAASPCC